jgi:capsular polysaccharide biosynthesis protein
MAVGMPRRKYPAANRKIAPATSGKIDTYKYRDALDFPAIDRAGLSDADSTCVYAEPPGVNRKFPRHPPEFIDDPDGVELFPEFRPDTITYSPAFVAAALRARVVGFRTVLTEDGTFFLDNSPIGSTHRQHVLRDLVSPDTFGEETGFEATPEPGRVVLDARGRSTKRIKKTTVLLSSQEPSNFGSWLFRVLPKLQTLAQIGFDEPKRYLVWVGLPSFMEYLGVLGIRKEQIIPQYPTNVIYQLDRVIVPSNRNNHAFLDPESVAFYAGLRDRFGEPSASGEKIYVSRLNHSQVGASTRVMINERDLIEHLVQIGFRIVAPEALSVPEQIRTFSSAQMVVGPSGSGMFNIVYCRPGTKVIDIESEPHWIHAHRCLFSSCGMRYGIFVGKAEDKDFSRHHKPWTLNVDALISRVLSFSQSS